MGDTITLTASDGFAFNAYRSEPSGPARAGLIVTQEIFGVNSHIRSVADRFAKEGFLAVAPAVYDRVEPGVELGYGQTDIEAGVAIARGKLDYELVTLDLVAAAGEARKGGKLGIVGYCWGGMIAARSALPPAIVDAAVGYYGGGIPNLLDRRPEVPLMLHFGELDQAISLSDVERVKTAWPKAIVHIYPGAAHGFNCDQRDSYDAKSAALALERTLMFFSEHL